MSKGKITEHLTVYLGFEPRLPCVSGIHPATESFHSITLFPLSIFLDKYINFN